MTRVYVSATFADLQEFRAAVQLALRRLRVEDVALASYAAEDGRPLERCLADVAACDVYVGIFAWRYGLIPPGYDRSTTELEYRAALAGGKPCLIFLLDENAPWPRRLMDRGQDAEKIEALRAELADRHMCSTFRDPAELAALVTAAVANCLTDEDRPAGGGLQLFSQETLRQYFGRLRQHYGVLDLDALTPEQTEEYLQVQLLSVFVEPWVREDPPPAELPREWRQRMQSDGRIGTEDLPEEVDPQELAHLHESYRAKPLRRLFDVLGEPDQRAVVLLGDPGSGKSTAARYLALSLADGPTDIRLAALADHLPLLIEVRAYATGVAEGRCDNFLDYLDDRAQTDGLGIERVLLERHLSLGSRTLVIFDGLDEVFDRRRREDVARQIAGFAAEYPQIRIIITSRIIGYSRRVLTEVGFAHYTLQDLTEDQTAEFLSNWYRLTARDQPGDVRFLQARSLAAMRHSPAIRELAGNPLLLTIMAIVGKHQPLPRERWRLYDHAATILVEQWDTDRHLREQSQVAGFLDTEDKKELLRRLAYRMQSAERGLTVNYIDREELSEVFEQYLVERYRHDPATARSMALTMINQFRERDFILGRYGPQLYGFVHRAFLEFFCADAILTRFQYDQALSFEQVKDLFRRHWADLSWREVLRLLAGALHQNHTAQLIDLLTREVNQPWPPGEFVPPPWNLALAVQCLAEVRDLPAAAGPAQALLRQLVLLLEHCVSIDDRETAGLIENRILPAVKAIGPGWPGRQIYLSWYRRRGVRIVWSPVSSHAARLAAMLSTPAERIDDLFDEVLGAMDDGPAGYAAVAGLTEVARLTADTEDNLAHRDTVARTRTRLVRRAREDERAGVRLAAIQALGEHFGTEPEVRSVLVERGHVDGYAGVRRAALQALDAGFREKPSGHDLLRMLLVERVRADVHPSVRLVAVRLSGDRYGGDPALRETLLRCLRTDPDAEVVRTAAHVLAERFAAGHEIRTSLVERVRTGTDAVPRRAAVRVLGELFAGDNIVRALLVDLVRTDRDPGVLRAAAQALIGRYGRDAAIGDLLVQRIRTDVDEIARRIALQVMIDNFGLDAALRDLLASTAQRDRDAEVRLVAARALSNQAGTDRFFNEMLSGLARGDDDARIRLVAVEALAQRVGVDTEVSELLAGLARNDVDAVVRLAAVDALADTARRSPAIRNALTERALGDNDAEIRLAALRALTRDSTIDDEVYQVLLDLAYRDRDARVFYLATTALIGRTGSRVELRRLLTERLRGDGNAQVRRTAVRLMIELFGIDAEVREALLERIRHDPDAELLREAAAHLATRSGTDAEQSEVLTIRATDKDPQIRAGAVRVLGEFFGTDPSVRELLVDRAGNDPDVRVRRAVLRVLGEHLPGHPEIRELFIERLRDQDWSVRAAAVLALGTHFGDDGQIRALLAELARSDPDPGFRRRAGQAITWLPGADSDQLPSIGSGAPLNPLGQVTDPADESRPGTKSRGDVIFTYQLSDVFKRNGIPTLTFVEPPNFSMFRMALRQPGLGIVIEGPSGIGKSTVLQRAVRLERERGLRIPVLSARRRDDVEAIRTLPSTRGRGVVAIDDFHRLPPELRESLTDHLKLLADEESRDDRLIIVGIPGTGRHLVELASDLATRIQIFQVPTATDALILEMVRKGEAALNVSFAQAGEIVELSRGSLSTAQMLCWYLATQNGIEQTQFGSVSVERGLDEALQEVERTLAARYQKVVRSFAALDGERQQACIELLLMLAATDGVLSLDEAAEQDPRLSAAIDLHLLRRFPGGFNGHEQLDEHLFLDPRARQLIIEDPQFLIYLRRQRQDELAKAVGKRISPRRSQVFISYSHRDADWLARLDQHLKPLVRRGLVDVWADTRISAGEMWRDELDAAMGRARAAILLVTADFFASAFVDEVELPTMLRAAREDGCRILPLIVKPSLFTSLPEVAGFQAFNPPSKPLSGLTEHEQEHLLYELAAFVLRLFDNSERRPKAG
ncbi:HEAT repeat domain-containing protein [Plantactinospora sp. S1510]|uniref:HEAT repeat domain-containing protein n=1 Tax=Plantactinospora alkalitolerans TaxID=2789879 RepID=A0ABS0GQ59_9ACTN|nr:HEAT repeat domain-containing protein [Plantactinospora alkalitolerans]MBF9128330.1 HEAT repeat domain-containing protein [Plantactinospora alkalitolerans]